MHSDLFKNESVYDQDTIDRYLWQTERTTSISRRRFLHLMAAGLGAAAGATPGTIGLAKTDHVPVVQPTPAGLFIDQNMAKNIVICSDGTGNWAGDAHPSNIYELCKLLDVDNDKVQIACYDPGVGTNVDKNAIAHLRRSQKNLKIFDDPPSMMPPWVRTYLGLAGGYGLEENLKQLYGYLVEKYAEGDNIYLFGFSRGAFTVRALAGMLCRCGVLKDIKLFSEAHDRCKIHYEEIEQTKSKDERKRVEDEHKEFKRLNGKPCKVKFLGIWDTIKSYGYLLPQSRAHTRHNEIVLTVRHALSIDERRKFFEQTHWGGLDDDPTDSTHECNPPSSDQNVQDVQEVWFVGDHSDVGGGHEDGKNGLAQIALKWMINEAVNAPQVDKEDNLKLLCNKNTLGKLSPIKRHDKLEEQFWKYMQQAPRKEMINCPYPQTSDWTRKSSGRRDIRKSKRNGKVLLHSSVIQCYSDSEKLERWCSIVPDPNQFTLIDTGEYVDK